MNEYQVRVVAAAAIEPVSLDSVKTDLRIDASDEDALLMSMVAEARHDVETWCRRALITRTLEMSLSGWPGDDCIRLAYPPAVSLTSVRYYDENNALQTMNLADLVLIADVEPGIVTLAKNASWPSAALRSVWPVRVRWVAGYGATTASVPEFYRSAIRALVAIRYEHRDEMTPNATRALDNVRASLMREWGW